MIYLAEKCWTAPEQKPCRTCRSPFPGCDEESCSDLSDWIAASAARGAHNPPAKGREPVTTGGHAK